MMRTSLVECRRSSKTAVVVATIVVLLALAGHVAREALVVEPLIMADQLMIATISVAQHEPGAFGRDLTYGSDAGRFYTPLQVELVWQLLQATGSSYAAYAAQLPAFVLLSFTVVLTVSYWLTRSLVVSLVMAAVATAFRLVPFGGEVWGVGPFATMGPRAWAGPIVFLVLGLWVRAVERGSGPLLALTGLVTGLTVNVNPPTGVPLSGVLILAAFSNQVARNWRDRDGWAWWLATAASIGLGAAPFLVNYASSATVGVAADYDAFLAAARYLYGQWIWPGVLNFIGSWVVVGPGEFFIKPLPLLILFFGVLALWTDRGARPRALALLIFTGAVPIATVAPILLQLVLLELRLSPIPAIDLTRGARFVTPLGIMFAGLGIASLLRRGAWAALGAVALAFLLLVSVYAPSAVRQFPQVDIWWWLALSLGLSLAITAGGRLGPRLIKRQAVSWTPHVVIVALAIGFPTGLLTAHFTSVGKISLERRITDELLASNEVNDWARALPRDALIDTSGAGWWMPLRLCGSRRVARLRTILLTVPYSSTVPVQIGRSTGTAECYGATR
jgi:hypothetical protein